MNEHIILSYALISMGVLHAQKGTNHQQTNCQIPSKEDLQNNIPGYLTFIKDKVNIKVTDDEIMELLNDFLNHKPSNKPINGEQGPSSLIAIPKNKNLERSSTSTEALIQTTQTNERGANDILGKTNTNAGQSNTQEESNINPMNVGRSATITKCRINEDDINYNHHKRLLLDIKDRNIRIASKQREKTKHNRELNKLLEGGTDKICKKSEKYKCEQLKISIEYCDTYIDDYEKEITKFTEEINSLCDEDDDEL